MAKKNEAKKEAKIKKGKISGKGERFADMSDTAVIIDEAAIESQLAETPEAVKKAKAVKVRGKKYQNAKKLLGQRAYPFKEALELLKKISFAKFNAAIEVHLNVLSKGLEGNINLPYFQAKAKKVVIFDETIAEAVKSGKIDFDILLATPADMPKILLLAKILGPKGLMPNPKNGTLIPDPKKALSNFSGNALHFKTEKDFPVIHTIVGRIEQPTEELEANFKALVKAIGEKNIKKAVLKSTMSPGVRVSL